MTGIDVDALTDELAEIEYRQWMDNHAGGIPVRAWAELGERVKRSRRNQIRRAVEFTAARVEQEVQDQLGVAELRERGLRVFGDDGCCELGCDGGACESCPCCCAGWCVTGRSGAIPTPDLTPSSDYRIWLDIAAQHNPVAARLAEVEGVAGLDYDEPARTDAAVREYINAHRDEINAGIKAALGQLNGTDTAAVSLMTGLSAEEIDGPVGGSDAN